MPIVRGGRSPSLMVKLFRSNGRNKVIAPSCMRGTTLSMTHSIPNFSVVYCNRSRVGGYRFIRKPGKGGMLYYTPSDVTTIVSRVSVRIRVKNGRGQLIGVYKEGMSLSCCGRVRSRCVRHCFGECVHGASCCMKRGVKIFGRAVGDRSTCFNSSTFISLVRHMRLRIAGTRVSFTDPISFITGVGRNSIYMHSIFDLCQCSSILCALHLGNSRIHVTLRVDCGL